jgi:hypothetical protein
MRVEYLFSSSEGDVLLAEKTLDRAFLLNPFEAHPFLTLRDYFQSIERFILDRVEVLVEKSKTALSPDRIGEMLIRSEKHGTLYQVASVEITGHGSRRKFAVSTAFSETRRKLLLHENETMTYLNELFPYNYIPKVYLASETLCSNPKGSDTVVMCVSEWLEGYHEWHLSVDQDGKQAVLIWDMEKGNRTASAEEGWSIFREASRILTLYYDPKTFRQIYPWHHAAGDFVVKCAGGAVEVKLTTVRNYLPLISFPTKADTNRAIALVAFLLNMTVQMRLDRIGGVGEPVWAQEEFVSPCLEGFFGALQTMKTEGRCDWGEGPDLPTLLKNFSKEELQRLYAPLMESYREEKPEDFKVIEKNLEDHIATLWKALQAFDEGGLPGGS